jgi:hypothetical protein
MRSGFVQDASLSVENPKAAVDFSIRANEISSGDDKNSSGADEISRRSHKNGLPLMGKAAPLPRSSQELAGSRGELVNSRGNLASWLAILQEILRRLSARQAIFRALLGIS